MQISSYLHNNKPFGFAKGLFVACEYVYKGRRTLKLRDETIIKKGINRIDFQGKNYNEKINRSKTYLPITPVLIIVSYDKFQSNLIAYT